LGLPKASILIKIATMKKTGEIINMTLKRNRLNRTNSTKGEMLFDAWPASAELPLGRNCYQDTSCSKRSLDK